MKDSRAAAVCERTPIRRNDELTHTFGVFDHLPSCRHCLGGSGQEQREKQSGKYGFSHGWSITPAELQDKASFSAFVSLAILDTKSMLLVWSENSNLLHTA